MRGFLWGLFTGPCYWIGWKSERLVGFLFHDGRAGQYIDLLFHGRALVIGYVDGTSQLNEFGPEILLAFAIADVVFYHPQGFIDGLELSPEAAQLGRVLHAFALGGGKNIQFIAYILELGGVAHALDLDFQNGDLVDQLAGADFNQDGSAHVCLT